MFIYCLMHLKKKKIFPQLPRSDNNTDNMAMSWGGGGGGGRERGKEGGKRGEFSPPLLSMKPRHVIITRH